MYNFTYRSEHHFPTGLPEAIAPVGLFPIHKKLFIHRTNFFDSILSDEHTTACYDIDFSYVAPVPPCHLFAPKKLALREDFI
jgi:hypothetical protein